MKSHEKWIYFGMPLFREPEALNAWAEEMELYAWECKASQEEILPFHHCTYPEKSFTSCNFLPSTHKALQLVFT